MKVKNLKIITLVILVTIILACRRAPAPKSEKPIEAVPVKVIKAQMRQMSQLLEYAGNIKAFAEAEVFPKVTGKIAEKIKEEGAFVEKGEVLAYIDRDEVGLKFEKAPVESPLSGLVGRIFVDIGANVGPQAAIGVIVDIDKVRISVAIPEKYVPKISPGQAAVITVDAYPDEEFLGSVTKVSPVIDESTRSAPIEITVENKNHRLKSGMFAKAKLVIGENKEELMVLKEAVIGKAEDAYLFTVENKKAFLKKVTIGMRQGPYLEILSGISEGDSVVIVGQQKLKDGIEVIVEEYQE